MAMAVSARLTGRRLQDRGSAPAGQARRYQLRVHAPAGGAQAQLHLTPVARPRHALQESAFHQVRDGAADAGLVHAGAGGDVLRGAAWVLADGRHDAPLRDLKRKATPVDGRQVLAHRGRQAVQTEGHEAHQLKRT
jgi:hypothetical protein